MLKGVPVAQKVKRWHAGRDPLETEPFLILNVVPLHTAFLSPSHRSDITKILVKMAQNGKSSIHQYPTAKETRKFVTLKLVKNNIC